MPSVSAFQRSFGIIKGLVLKDKISSFTLKEIDIKHKVKKIYQEYEFPLTLEFIGSPKKGSENRLINLIKSSIGAKDGSIVYSDYGSPYECGIGEPCVEEVFEEEHHYFQLAA